MRNTLLALLALALLLPAASAGPNDEVIMVYNVNPGVDGNFVNGDTNIFWEWIDTNTTADNNRHYYATISYSTTRSGTRTAIVSDLNIGHDGADAGYCYGDTDFTNSATGCGYPLTTTTLSDGNYIFDVNIAVMYVNDLLSDKNSMGDLNMDGNHSIYIDNTAPVCEFEKMGGKTYRWNITEAAIAAGGSAAVLHRVDDENYTVTTVRKHTEQYVELSLSTGRHDYDCYVLDYAGNTGATVSKERYRYPEGSSVTFTPPAGGELVAGLMAANIAGIPLPIIGVGLIIGYIYLSGGKKKGRRTKKKKRRR